MKLIKKAMEISIAQLEEMYHPRPGDLKYLLASAKCHSCRTELFS
ncbi:MAG: hypothetical protein Q8M08_04445 [Bacteroidales bacterium]|nr:hypothetical protein [Bacteroidales bacterium]